MIINIFGAKCIGIDALPVTIEVDISSGIGIHLVGLADIAVKESLLRTMTALQTLGYRIPGKKIVINLAPADMHKNGSGYDLPIALGIIAASGQEELPFISDYIIMGELGLDGSLKRIPGALPFVELAMRKGLKGCILPSISAAEALEYRKTSIYGADNLYDVLAILKGSEGYERFLVCNRNAFSVDNFHSGDDSGDVMDFSEIIGQEGAKRGLEIAAAGGHNVIMVGPPGSGKSSLAKALSGILPPMTFEESLTTSKIYSVAGKGDIRFGLMHKRPFRSPHCSASMAAVIGGGKGENILPGEISLAQNGILFLDEFCEIKNAVAEALRGPLEDRKVVISRLRCKIEYPASFMLVAATNPCPCGYYGEGDRCSCTSSQRAAYMSKLSGPIMDRIDIQLWLHPVDPDKMVRRYEGETSEAVLSRVSRARKIQKDRFSNENIFVNSGMNNRMLKDYCPLSDDCKEMITKIITVRKLSARAFARIVKISRTIADLAGSEDIMLGHIVEAAGLRFLDKTYGGLYN
ncbi:MAG: YifB family Mg chelatase-like AAA ATPase [Bacteroidales bacterium]|nr:YifB family Mg chelatase-like AAA ATPase [Bacteroidales bacterium]MCI1784722.1 YifB family Mg chelatase-like AAA ATPase [Bacteroidales bacterium]